MIIKTFTMTPFQQNTRIVVCEETKKAICIDPGEKSDAIFEFLTENNYELQAITLTHGHLDHVGGTLDLHKSFPQVEIILHERDEDLYYALTSQPILLGIQPHQLKALGMDYDDPPKLTRNWEDGELYEVGRLRFKILHCPGHTLGHIVMAEEVERKVFVGDCLFEGSIGRTDLPGGSHAQLIDSINDKILTLGDDFTIYSGHGRETTIGRERASNPYLTGGYNLSRGKYL